MPIPNKESARYSSLQEFIGFFKDSDNNPSFSNLFSVHFATPPMLRNQTESDIFVTETGDLSLLLDYYAKSVNLPSKQITTGQITDVGSGFKYATGTAFSQISMTFTVPRSQLTRNFFERWTRLMANDGNQYTDFYLNYCCPKVVVYKWERGGGDDVFTDPKLLRSLRESGVQNSLFARKNKLTAAWELRNVFPYNIGSVQLDNGQAKTMDLSVQFYYERYRFWTENEFDDSGLTGIITIPSGADAPAGTSPVGGTDNTTTPDTPRNTTARRNPRALLDQRQLLSGRFLSSGDQA